MARAGRELQFAYPFIHPPRSLPGPPPGSPLNVEEQTKQRLEPHLLDWLIQAKADLRSLPPQEARERERTSHPRSLSPRPLASPRPAASSRPVVSSGSLVQKAEKGRRCVAPKQRSLLARESLRETVAENAGQCLEASPIADALELRPSEADSRRKETSSRASCERNLVSSSGISPCGAAAVFDQSEEDEATRRVEAPIRSMFCKEDEVSRKERKSQDSDELSCGSDASDKDDFYAAVPVFFSLDSLDSVSAPSPPLRDYATRIPPNQTAPLRSAVCSNLPRIIFSPPPKSGETNLFEGPIIHEEAVTSNVKERKNLRQDDAAAGTAKEDPCRPASEVSEERRAEEFWERSQGKDVFPSNAEKLREVSSLETSVCTGTSSSYGGSLPVFQRPFYHYSVRSHPHPSRGGLLSNTAFLPLSPGPQGKLDRPASSQVRQSSSRRKHGLSKTETISFRSVKSVGVSHSNHAKTPDMGTRSFQSTDEKSALLPSQVYRQPTFSAGASCPVSDMQDLYLKADPRVRASVAFPLVEGQEMISGFRRKQEGVLTSFSNETPTRICDERIFSEVQGLNRQRPSSGTLHQFPSSFVSSLHHVQWQESVNPSIHPTGPPTARQQFVSDGKKNEPILHSPSSVQKETETCPFTLVESREPHSSFVQPYVYHNKYTPQTPYSEKRQQMEALQEQREGAIGHPIVDLPLLVQCRQVPICRPAEESRHPVHDLRPRDFFQAPRQESAEETHRRMTQFLVALSEASPVVEGRLSRLKRAAERQEGPCYGADLLRPCSGL